MGKINNTITLSRVLGMFLILACHAVRWMGMEALGQILCVGVPVFFFMSGYLYGNKVIENKKQFLIKRFYRIYIPLWGIMVPLWLLELWNQNAGILDIIPYIFGTHGMKWLMDFWPGAGITIEGSGHLWFLTVILLCYGMLLVVSVMDIQWKGFFLAGSILMFVLPFVGIHIHYFLVFFAGYFMAKQHITLVTMKKFAGITAVMLIAVMLRLVMMWVSDGTILYDRIIAPVALDILGIWIIACVDVVRNKSSVIEKLATWKPLMWMADISYYVYITHNIILESSYSVEYVADMIFVVFVMIKYIVLTFISAVLLKAVCDVVYKMSCIHGCKKVKCGW